MSLPIEIPEPISCMDSKARNALSSRKLWEDKLLEFYRLRHSLMTRAKKPWPGAADMNWPLADMMIEKIKPYYIQQTFANELLANFYALSSTLQPFNTAAAQWFDHRIRQRTNFETEIISVADYMLATGKGVMKVRWCVDDDKVVFDACDPIAIIVPSHTTVLAEADWLIQVHQLSPEAYERTENYNQTILPHIKQSAAARPAESGAAVAAETTKFQREGLTIGSDENQIIVWEVYRKVGKKVEMFSFCPTYPHEFVREVQELPYDHGKLPFVEFNAEIKDKGYYSSRGVPERVASLQRSMTKLWNEKLDALTLYNRPMFASDSTLINPGNVRLVPGAVIPFPVRRLAAENPPISWDVELNQHRSTAEQMIGVPDAGLTNLLSGNERRTAAEANLIAGIMSQVVDLRSRVFRKALAEAFSQAWSLLVQYDNKSLDYFYRNELMSLPPVALSKDYMIEPLASADNLNKQFVFQKKVQRFQMLANNPFVNQGNLVRDLIAADDPQDVKSLFMDNTTQSADQAEDQASEINRMLIGFPSQVKPVDEDATHLEILNGFVERRVQTGEPITPELAALLMNHANMHYRQLLQKNEGKALEMEPQLQKLAAFLGSIVSQAQQAQQEIG